MICREKDRGLRQLTTVILASIAVVVLAAAAKSDERILLFPKLHNGDTLQYESHARLSRSVKTKSNVTTMFQPGPLQADFSTNWRLSVQDFHAIDRRPRMAAETQLLLVQPANTNDANAKPVKVSF